MNIIVNKENKVDYIKIKNDKNLEVTFCSFGASIYSIMFKNKSMTLSPVNHEDFYKEGIYHGKIIGRFSGRIDNAQCVIDGKKYTLDKNWNGINSLHGGNEGISHKVFNYEIIDNKKYVDVVFKYLEKEDKLPGDVTYTIIYRVYSKLDNIDLFIEANTTKETIVNITNHIYFNLNNNVSTILDESLKLNCDKYGDLDNNLICKEIKQVNDIMDFRDSHKVKDYISDPYLVNHTAFGYDHFWIKENESNPFIAELSDELSNVKLTVATSYPAIVIYTNNYKTDIEFYPNCQDAKHQAICLECQYVPNGINMDGVNKGLLKPEETYRNYISYQFEEL